MPRPPRADRASTRIVGFRLTEDEEARLDELVTEQGHKDRSALLRAWLEQGGPAPRHVAPKQEQRGLSSANDKPTPQILERVSAALRQHSTQGFGLIRVPSVVREFVPRVPLAQVHAVLLELANNGKLELRPEAGREFLRDEDAALCPPGPRGTVLSTARWLDHDREHTGPSLGELSLEHFAAHVQSAANRSRSVWPRGGEKVFVSVLYRELGAAETQGLDLRRFKSRLVEAHRAGLVVLSRCDLVELADPRNVDESEMRALNAEWHLIRQTAT